MKAKKRDFVDMLPLAGGLIGATLGFGFALLVLLGTLLGIGTAYFNLGFASVAGPLAAIIGVPVMTVIAALIGLLLGVVTRWLVRRVT